MAKEKVVKTEEKTDDVLMVEVTHEDVLCNLIDKVNNLEKAVSKMAHMTGQDKTILEFNLEKFQPKTRR